MERAEIERKGTAKSPWKENGSFPNEIKQGKAVESVDSSPFMSSVAWQIRHGEKGVPPISGEPKSEAFCSQY